MRLNSNWRVRLFREVAETLSFTAAAERLHISQPAVSRQVKDLESAIGAPLFDRSRRRLVLTETGEIFLRHARRLLQHVDEAEQELALSAKGQAGQLSLGAANVWEYLLPRFMCSFTKQYPRVVMTLSVGTADQIVGLVAEFKISLGFVWRDPEVEELEAAPIAEHEMVIIAPVGHPLAKRVVPPAALNDAPFVMAVRRLAQTSTLSLPLHSEYLERLGVRPSVVLDLRTAESIKAAVRSGMGLGILSEHAVEVELAHGVLARLRLDAPPFKRPLYVLRNRSRSYSATQQAFVDHVSEGLRQRADVRASRTVKTRI